MIRRSFPTNNFQRRKLEYSLNDIKREYTYIKKLNEKLGLYNIDNSILLDRIIVAYKEYLKLLQKNQIQYERVFELWHDAYYYMLVIRSNILNADYIKIYVNLGDYDNVTAFVCIGDVNDTIKVEQMNPNSGATFYKDITDDNDTMQKIEFLSIILNIPYDKQTQYSSILSVINHELTHAVLQLNNLKIHDNNSKMLDICDIFKNEFGLNDTSNLDANQLKTIYNNIYGIQLSQYISGYLLNTIIYYADYTERAAFLHVIPDELYPNIMSQIPMHQKHDKQIFNNIINSSHIIVDRCLLNCDVIILYKNIQGICENLKNNKLKLTWPDKYSESDFVYDYLNKISLHAQCKDLDIIISKVETFDDILDIWIASCECFIQKAIKIAMNFDELNYMKYKN